MKNAIKVLAIIAMWTVVAIAFWHDACSALILAVIVALVTLEIA